MCLRLWREPSVSVATEVAKQQCLHNACLAAADAPAVADAAAVVALVP